MHIAMPGLAAIAGATMGDLHSLMVVKMIMEEQDVQMVSVEEDMGIKLQHLICLSPPILQLLIITEQVQSHGLRICLFAKEAEEPMDGREFGLGRALSIREL